MARRLADARGRRVVFLSHCLLDENTRYLGGARRAGCVREIVDQCIDGGIGMIQMPCPEQAAWGGVRKRRMLRLYGSPLAAPLAPIALAYTRAVYRRLARRVAREVADCVESGITVVGVVAVDGSPSCGLGTTLDLAGALRDIATLDPRTVSVADQNELVRRHAIAGQGILVEELQRELARRGLDVPFLAHDLIGELEGRQSRVRLPVLHDDEGAKPC
jgi:predicted secreted protein